VGEFLSNENISVVHMFPRAAYLMHYINSDNVFKVVEQSYGSPNLKRIGIFDGGFSLSPRALVAGWYRKYVRLNCRLADLVITSGEGQRQASIKVFGVDRNKTAIVTPGKPSRRSVASPGKFRTELGVKDTQKIVVSVGRVTQGKGVEEYAEIASQVTKMNPNVRFVFVGKAPDRAYERRILSRYGDLVKFLGHRDDIPDILVDSDIYLHPSHREGLPGAIIESMDFGLPALAWNIPGCNELISNGENGVLCDFGVVNAMADAVVKIATNPEISTAMGVSARKIFESEFDVSDYALRILEAYRSAGVDVESLKATSRT
jgi:glycosyltransferase involved in cell wall biosynthesis